jgi:hypothetical protein
MALYSITGTSQQKDQTLWFKSEMTYRQFASLSIKLLDADIENEIINLDYFKNKLGKAKNMDVDVIEKWLKNSWNTESVLIQNKSILENTGQSFAIQWAFPQAYYSTYTSLLAHYKALGYTQESHTSVLKFFGSLIEQNRLPETLSFYCTGGKEKIIYININKPQGIDSLTFDKNNKETIDNHICQFLKATREIKLDEKKLDLRLKNKKGQKSKKLNPSQWEQVSDSIGHTTIMDLLYRKRIKANYQDIETFSSIEFKGLEVHECLCNIVNRLNLINECYVAKAISYDKFEEIVIRFLKRCTCDSITTRLETIKTLLEVK